MSIFCIRLPSRTAAEDALSWVNLPCPYVQVSQNGTIESDGVGELSVLSPAIAKAQRIILILSASDVTILRLTTPPLSSSRLKAALPNLVEEHLLSDPADCLIHAGDEVDGQRTVAVTSRAWLELVTNALTESGARQISAVPAQLCLTHSVDPNAGASAAAYEWDKNVDLTVRLSAYSGIGITIASSGENSEASGPVGTIPQVVLQTLSSLVPSSPVTLCVPPAQIRKYEQALSSFPDLSQRITLCTDNWSRWVNGTLNASMNLISALGRSTVQPTNWRPWRWSLILTTALLLINVGALNFDWWRMNAEARSLRVAMIDIYRSAYPKETVIIDPVAQLRQKVSLEQVRSGIAGTDEFSSLLARFGAAWSRIAPAGAPYTIAAISFHDRVLQVRLKAPKDRLIGDADTSLVKQLGSELAKHDISLEVTPGQGDQVVWKIRGNK